MLDYICKGSVTEVMEKTDAPALSLDFERLRSADKNCLDKLWRQYCRSATKPASLDIMIRKIAWSIQEQSLGGICANTKRKLDRTADRQVQSVVNKYRLVSGAILKRVWNNHTYIVCVLNEKEFEYNGRVYRSLTKIAKEITGTHQSGPVFFGLRGRDERRS